MAGDAPGTAGPVPAPSGTPPAPVPLALYRKYRPATFAEVKGQEHVTEPLRQALRNGRVHHAYLFSGPRGCGKTSSARILARSLNCAQGPTPDPCGVCESCVALAPSGPGSFDVIEIDAASHGGVDDARDLRERAVYAPVSGRFKVYIIDEAHMVTREGFNALLKLVEEPPPHLKFVFATTEPEKVIPTIRSRTHHYPFRLVPPAVLRELLEQILAAEGVSYQPSVLPLVVRAGAGSVRDSLSVLDQLLAGAGPEGLTYEQTAALLGYSDDNLLDEIVSALAAGDGAAVFGAVDRAIQAGHDPRRFAADLLDRLRDLIILAAVPGAGKTGLLEVPTDRLERMSEQAGRFGQAELARAAEIVSDGLVQMRGTASPRLLLELMCAQILLPGTGTGERALLARLERLEQRVAGMVPGRGSKDAGLAPGPASDDAGQGSDQAGMAGRGARQPSPVPARPSGQEERARPASTREEPARPVTTREEPARPASTREEPARPASTGGGSGPATINTVRERWPEILEAVRGERRVAWMLLQPATARALADGVLTVEFPRGGNAKGFASSGYDQVLATVLNRLLGLAVRVRAVAATSQPATAQDPPAPAEPTAAYRAPQPGAGQAEPAPPAPGPGVPQPGPAEPHQPGPAEPHQPGPAEPHQPGAARAHQLGAGEPGGGLTGMELIQHQLGGQIIEEFGEP
jgi:DNA polymerase-3 subunit gamma/tau